MTLLLRNDFLNLGLEIKVVYNGVEIKLVYSNLDISNQISIYYLHVIG